MGSGKRAPGPSSRPGRRARQKAETGQLILEAAKELFAEKGFEKTTIRDIARQAGVGVGTVLNHYPDKASLLIAALLGDLTGIQEETLAAMPQGLAFREQCLHIVRPFFAYYARRPGLSRTLLKESLFIPGPWGAKLQQEALFFLEVVAGLVEQAKSRGEIRPEAKAYLAASSLFACYLAVLNHGLSQPAFVPESLIALLGSMLDQFLAGIGPRG